MTRPLILLLVVLGSYQLAIYLQRRRERQRAQTRLEALRAIARMQRADRRDRWPA